MEDLKLKVEELGKLLKSLQGYEKKGLDTSSLKLFIKTLKTFIKLEEIESKKGTETKSKKSLPKYKCEIGKPFSEWVDIIGKI